MAVDTVTDIGSVAIEVDGTVVERVFEDRRHAASLLPTMLDLLRMNSRDLSDVDEFLVADGPGSFTGIRIGFATIAGIVATLPATVVCVAPSMKASCMAHQRSGKGTVAVLYEALRGEVFAAAYSRDDRSIRTEVPPHVTGIVALRKSLGSIQEVLVADAAVKHASDVVEWIGKPPVPIQPRAGNLLSLRDLERGVVRVESMASFTPTYGRLAEAQVRWEREHGRSLSDPSG